MLFRTRSEGALGSRLLIATIFLLPSAVFAQSSVMLYGTLDAGILFTSKSTNPTTGQNAGRQFQFVSSGNLPSTFGLQGQEDLGGGLKAKFQLESGISLANGGFDNENGGLFGREAWVALSNNLGEVKLGLQYSPFVIALFDSDPRSFSQFASAITVYCNNTFTGTFVPNAVTYTTPKLAGFTASAMYSLGGVAGDFHAGRQYSASLKYEFGGLMINAAIDDTSSSSDSAMNSTFFSMPFEGRTLGITYRFASVNVKASFTNYKAPETVVSGVTGGGDSNVWNIGFDYFVTPALSINSGVWIVRDPHDSNNHSVTAALGTNYSLSKRTSLYVQLGLVNNHGQDIYGLDRDGAPQGLPGTTVGALVGMLHNF
jgi:predicted porin